MLQPEILKTRGSPLSGAVAGICGKGVHQDKERRRPNQQTTAPQLKSVLARSTSGAKGVPVIARAVAAALDGRCGVMTPGFGFATARVIGVLANENAPVPMAFTAATRNTYLIPSWSPVTWQEVTAPVHIDALCQVVPPSLE